MKTLYEEIKSELSKKKANKKAIDLWESIFSWYQSGGKKTVKENVTNQIKATGKKFKQEAETVKIIAKLKKSPKKRR